MTRTKREYTVLCEVNHIASLVLCHKVSRITCYYDAKIQFTMKYMDKTTLIRPNYYKIRAKKKILMLFLSKKSIKIGS